MAGWGCAVHTAAAADDVSLPARESRHPAPCPSTLTAYASGSMARGASRAAWHARAMEGLVGAARARCGAMKGSGAGWCSRAWAILPVAAGIVRQIDRHPLGPLSRMTAGSDAPARGPTSATRGLTWQRRRGAAGHVQGHPAGVHLCCVDARRLAVAPWLGQLDRQVAAGQRGTRQHRYFEDAGAAGARRSIRVGACR